MDDSNQADYIRTIGSNGGVFLEDYSLVASDNYSQSGTISANPITWLLVRDTTVVPVPAAAWLFGSGLLGLVGLARRKA